MQTFTVEIRDADQVERRGAQVEIYIDRASLEELLRDLRRLAEPGDHAHFMTPSWGGDMLSETPQVSTNAIVDHLKITLV
jgi:hypothetical protein